MRSNHVGDLMKTQYGATPRCDESATTACGTIDVPQKVINVVEEISAFAGRPCHPCHQTCLHHGVRGSILDLALQVHKRGFDSIRGGSEPREIDGCVVDRSFTRTAAASMFDSVAGGTHLGPRFLSGRSVCLISLTPSDSRARPCETRYCNGQSRH